MFAVVVVLTLAVGIGVNVAVFSLFERIMLRELNVAHPRELVNLVGRRDRQSRKPASATSREGAKRRSAIRCSATSRPRVDAYVDLAASRIIVASARPRRQHVRTGSAVLVSGGYFAALGVGPELGRVLGEQDVDATAQLAAVVLSL